MKAASVRAHSTVCSYHNGVPCLSVLLDWTRVLGVLFRALCIEFTNILPNNEKKKKEKKEEKKEKKKETK